MPHHWHRPGQHHERDRARFVADLDHPILGHIAGMGAEAVDEMHRVPMSGIETRQIDPLRVPHRMARRHEMKVIARH
jgi:hypothetical protein